MRRFTRWTAAGVVAFGAAAGVASGWSHPAPPNPSTTTAPATPSQAPTVLPAVAVVAADVPRQEAAVSLIWRSPVEGRVGKASRYTLTATNTCNQVVQKVTVQVRVPAGVASSGCTPAPRTVDGVLLWDVGHLRPNEARDLVMDFTPSARGPLAAEAWVTFTGTAAATVAVREPRIEVSCTAPTEVPLGGSVPYRYVIRNTGDVPVTGVRFEQRHLTPPPTGELGAPGTPAAGAVSESTAPLLAPGAEYVVTKHLPANGRGELHVGFDVTADDGLAATTSSRTKVTAPKLEVVVTGPAEVGLSKAVTYAVTVTNTGDLPVERATLTCEAGAGIKLDPNVTPAAFSDKTPSPAHTPWDVRQLRPGESRTFRHTGTGTRSGEVFFKAVAVEQLPSQSARPAATAGREHKTVVRGVPGIRMEVTDSVDPVRVSGETVYEVKVTNTGTEADRNLQLACNLPAGTELLSATGPTAYLERVGVDFNAPGQARNQRTVTFEPVRELGPQTEVVFRVRVRATATGDGRFRAAITSDHLTTPVVREESTTVYGN